MTDPSPQSPPAEAPVPAAHPLLDGDRVAQWLGVELEVAEKDHARIRMTLREDHHNGFGIAHGGAVFAFADTCFALTGNDPHGDGSTVAVASGVDVNFLAATRAGQTLVAEGRLVAAAGRSGVYDITVTTDDGAGVTCRVWLLTGASRRLAGPGAWSFERFLDHDVNPFLGGSAAGEAHPGSGP